ncbi:MAG: FAD-dependent thymidylate synthase [Elusimicrobia bacterium]|nr:FAD-dependent thymidylate synthase [Elusimicrobiota bacterium]
MGSIQVLDKGFVRLIERMGGDEAVVQAARVSFGQASKGPESDRRLIDYLLEHGHHTPFEHSVFKFHVKCPIFVMRQWIRHRVASYNEISARYAEVKDEYYVPPAWRIQDLKNKQGSAAARKLDHAALSAEYEAQVRAALAAYRRLLGSGVAREMARMVLPVSMYTQFYWTVNCRSLMNFINLRADAHAQSEMQAYAEAVAGVFAEKMPWTYAAFLKHVWTGSNAGLDKDKRRLCADAKE